MDLPQFGGTRAEAEKKERPWGAMTSGDAPIPFAVRKKNLAQNWLI